MALLEARGIGRLKPDSTDWLLRDINLVVNSSSRLAIVGPTGSGKTTLLRVLVLLDAVDSGQVLWHGQPIRDNQVPNFRKQVVYLHQRPSLFDGTVEQNLRLPYSFRAYRNAEFSPSLVVQLLEQVQRDRGFLNRPVGDLSGGEVQIVALVRALQLEPTMLLLDEPTASLDEATARLVEQLVLGWLEQSSASRSLIWISHDREQVQRIATRVVTMNEGELRDTE